MLYSICGLTVEFTPIYDHLKQRAEKYILSDRSASPDITLSVTPQDIEEYDRSRIVSSKAMSEYILCGADFYNKILDFEGFFLHSSAVELDGQAYLFTAPCGGGKSTHARIWRTVFKNCTAINDDKPAIRRIDGKFYACGTPFSGKHDLNANVIVPLRGICVIEQAPENSIEKLPAITAARILFEQTVRKLNAERTAILLTLFDELLSTIPVYRLRCNISAEAAYMSYKAMSGNGIES